MKTLKHIVVLAVVGSMLIFAGCEEEETTKTVSKEEAENILEENSQELNSQLEAMESSRGMQTMQTLTALAQQNDPFAQQKSLGEESIIRSIQKTLKPVENKNNLKRFGDQPFNFGDHTGTYTWQSEGVWNVNTNTPSDRIVIEFPADTAEDPVDNNAVFTLSNYEETAVTDSLGEEVYIPTRVEANLEVDGEMVASIDWTLEVTEVDGNQAVALMDASIYLNPFTYEVNLTQNSLSASISRDEAETTLMSVNMDVTFMDNMEDVKRLEGNVQVRNLNFEGWIKPYAMQNPDIQDAGEFVEYYNNQIDLALFKYDTGEKIADVKFVESDSQTGEGLPMQLVFEFEDGSTTPVKEYFQNIYQYLQQLTGMAENL